MSDDIADLIGNASNGSVSPCEIDCGCSTDDTVDFDYEKIPRMTDAAVLFKFDDGSEHWFPKSVIWQVGAQHVTVARWFAEREGLA